MSVHIGTSGWSYAHWANVLYPEGLPTEGRLDQYVRQFSTVELNASYYRWPSDAAFTRWRRRLPAEFLMTVKAPQCINGLHAGVVNFRLVLQSLQTSI